MAKFRKKPVVIEAVQWKGGKDNLQEVESFAGKSFFCWHYNRDTVSIDTLEGTMSVKPGDWIIRGVKGEFYPCKPDIFNATYEVVE